MKKKILSTILGVLITVCSLGLVGCEEHQHTFSEEWSYNQYNHFHGATCEHTMLVTDKDRHTLNENEICTICGYDKQNYQENDNAGNESGDNQGGNTDNENGGSQGGNGNTGGGESGGNTGNDQTGGNTGDGDIDIDNLKVIGEVSDAHWQRVFTGIGVINYTFIANSVYFDSSGLPYYDRYEAGKLDKLNYMRSAYIKNFEINTGSVEGFIYEFEFADKYYQVVQYTNGEYDCKEISKPNYLGFNEMFSPLDDLKYKRNATYDSNSKTYTTFINSGGSCYETKIQFLENYGFKVVATTTSVTSTTIVTGVNTTTVTIPQEVLALANR